MFSLSESLAFVDFKIESYVNMHPLEMIPQILGIEDLA